MILRHVLQSSKTTLLMSLSVFVGTSSSLVAFSFTDAPTVEAEALTYMNAVVKENCPDPGVLNQSPTYYVVCTTHTLPAFPIRKSTDLVNWTNTGKYVFTDANKPRWANDHFWAPEIHQVGSKYIAYYTARNNTTNRLCIGAATASTAEGRYKDLGKPLICDNVTVLDAHFFRDDNGKQYLYWKADAADGNPSGPIYGQEVASDGLTLVGSRFALIKNDLAWEGRLVEAPWVVKRNGQYYLFYSGNDFNTTGYATGVATSSSPLGGFTKKGDPILKSGTKWKAPGHNSIAAFNGNDYILNHAWEGDVFQDVRPTLLDRVLWGSDGWPAINDGTPSETAQPYPN